MNKPENLQPRETEMRREEKGREKKGREQSEKEIQIKKNLLVIFKDKNKQKKLKKMKNL